MRRPSREALASLAVLVVAALVTGLYVSSQRTAGDVTAATSAIEDASKALAYLAPEVGTRQAVQEVIPSDQSLDMFLASESADRMPELASALGNVDVAVDGAFELKMLADRGETTPTVGEAPIAADAVDALPQLARLRSGSGDAAVIANGGGAAVAALREAAQAELQAAADLVARSR